MSGSAETQRQSCMGSSGLFGRKRGKMYTRFLTTTILPVLIFTTGGLAQQQHACSDLMGVKVPGVEIL